MTAFTGDVLQFHAMYDLEDIRFSCILLAHFPPKTQHTYTGSQSPTRVALKKSVLLAERSLVRHHPITTQLSICLHPGGEGGVSLVCGPSRQWWVSKYSPTRKPEPLHNDQGTIRKKIIQGTIYQKKKFKQTGR